MAHIALCFGLRSSATRKRAIEQGYLLEMMNITFTGHSVQKKYAELKRLTLEYLYEDAALGK